MFRPLSHILDEDTYILLSQLLELGLIKYTKKKCFHFSTKIEVLGQMINIVFFPCLMHQHGSDGWFKKIIDDFFFQSALLWETLSAFKLQMQNVEIPEPCICFPAVKPGDL